MSKAIPASFREVRGTGEPQCGVCKQFAPYERHALGRFSVGGIQILDLALCQSCLEKIEAAHELFLDRGESVAAWGN